MIMKIRNGSTMCSGAFVLFHTVMERFRACEPKMAFDSEIVLHFAVKSSKTKIKNNEIFIFRLGNHWRRLYPKNSVVVFASLAIRASANFEPIHRRNEIRYEIVV